MVSSAFWFLAASDLLKRYLPASKPRVIEDAARLRAHGLTQLGVALASVIGRPPE